MIGDEDRDEARASSRSLPDLVFKEPDDRPPLRGHSNFVKNVHAIDFYVVAAPCVVATIGVSAVGRVVTVLFEAEATILNGRSGPGAPVLLGEPGDFQAARGSVLTLTFNGAEWLELARYMHSGGGPSGR